MSHVYAFGCKTIFLGEARSKAYIRYAARALEAKRMFGAKNTLEKSVLLAFRKCVA